MIRYRFELAGPGDDADLRHILAATPMPGAISVSFQREPSYFAGGRVDGRFRQVLAARRLDTSQLVAFGCRSIMPRFVNGRAEAIGYLSTLRILREHRKRGLMARGHAYLRRLHRDGRTGLYLVTIAEGNRMAEELLTSGRANLPRYHSAGRFHPIAMPMPTAGRPRRPRADDGIQVRPARREELPQIVEWLRAEGPRRQFFPLYERGDFDGADGLFKDLRLDDLLIAWRETRIVGTLAAWDQTGFRQTVVQSYGRLLGALRPVYDAWARWRGRPALPAPGVPIRSLTASLPVVHGDDPRVFAALVDAIRARAAGRYLYLMLGLHESDPLLAAVRRWEATWYTTRLYLACWNDGEALRSGLDGRPPYLELGCL
jgi:hypothetical protein